MDASDHLVDLAASASDLMADCREETNQLFGWLRTTVDASIDGPGLAAGLASVRADRAESGSPFEISALLHVMQVAAAKCLATTS